MTLLRLFFLMALVPQLLFGQDEKTDIREMQQAYASARSFSMQINLKVFAHATDPSPVQTANGQAMKMKENYYSEMLGRITIVNDHCCLLIDKTQKSILYSSIDAEHPRKQNEDAPIATDSMLTAGATLKYLSKTAAERRIEIKYKNDAQYDRIEMTIDPVNHTLLKVVYYYRTTKELRPSYEKTEITYSGILLNNALPPSQFSETTYIKVTRDKVIPLGAYAAYEVIDQRQYNKLATDSK